MNRISVCKILSAIFAIPIGTSLFWIVINMFLLLPTLGLVDEIGIWGLLVSLGLCIPFAITMLVEKFFLPSDNDFDFSYWIIKWGLFQFIIIAFLGALLK